jgi:hypothetical protein
LRRRERRLTIEKDPDDRHWTSRRATSTDVGVVVRFASKVIHIVLKPQVWTEEGWDDICCPPLPLILLSSVAISVGVEGRCDENVIKKGVDGIGFAVTVKRGWTAVPWRLVVEVVEAVNLCEPGAT